MTPVEEIIELFETRGHQAYFGESVSILEHSLQTAWLARQAGAEPDLVLAALLHDVGHLLHGLPEDIADSGVDGRHEIGGEVWLRSRFGAAVTEPVRLHVDAKRYLCYADPAYLGQLSASSLRSLELQGGPFTSEEARAFERHPHFRNAIALRRWDDAAKIPGLQVPDLRGMLSLI
jgi:phosphonate degradation associated HDIG domain protein